MGIRKLGDIIVLDFTTHNPFTGAVQDTDSLPTCEVFEDDNDSAILTPTVTKRVGKIGNYRISIEATTGNGFEIGKSYNVIISAIVNEILAKSRIESFVLDSKRINDLNDLAQSQILSDSTPFAGVSVDLIKTEVDKIQPDIIDDKDAFKADVSLLALDSTVAKDATVAKEATLIDKASQSSVDAIKSDTESIITTLSTLVADVWSYTTRTLTSFGTLIDDISLSVWSYTTRTITAGGITAAEIWAYITRTLTSGTKDSEIDLIKLETDKIQPQIIDKKDEFKADVSALALNSTVAKETTLNTKASQASIDLIKTETDKIKKNLGLVQENFVLTDLTYDGTNLISAKIKIYTDSTLNTLITQYQMTAVFDSEGKCTNYQVKEA